MGLVQNEDVPYEEDVQRNRYSLQAWLRYLEFKRDAPARERNVLHERALVELPGSYKLWHAYLTERCTQLKGKCVTDFAYEEANDVFERSLVTMYKMPRVWLMFLEHLTVQHLITRARRTFDRALRSLPLTQHERVWKLYIPWVSELNLPETATRVYRRYLQMFPDEAEEYVEYLLKMKRWEEAAERLGGFLSNPDYVSRKGKSKHQLWLELCDILSTHPQCGRRMKVEQIIRQGLGHFVDQVGRLWTALANYYIRQANFEKARDVFEEAISSVMTVRDFVHIWDAYTQFEDSMLEAYVLQREEAGTADSGKDAEREKVEFELKVARYEYLIDRRPLLYSSVVLRQNPHNVNEWNKRVRLYKNPRSIIETYQRAIKTVDAFQAVGKPHTLWVNFARFYSNNDEVESARIVFEEAVKQQFKSYEDLAAIWCEYAEMELRHRNFQEARLVLQRATALPANYRNITRYSTGLQVQQKVFKSTRLWSLLADVEESLGTFESTRAAYDRIIELHVATPQLIINYAALLEENKYFEDSYKAFEKGVALFHYPYSLDIWITYLKKFVDRYGGTKIERTRDLFEQAIEKVPAEFAKILYVTYAEVEEEYGFIRHAMSIYDRATKAVADEDKFLIYQLYIARATDFFGVPRTREIYEKAVQTLPDKQVKPMCMQYADLECKLGEVDRARAIYVHCSQYCDPQSNPDFWKVWREFEVRHGNEDTFREMLRIRRSVQAQYNTSINFTAANLVAATSVETGAPASASGEDSMQALERSATQAGAGPAFQAVPQPQPPGGMRPAAPRSEEIDIGDDDADEEEEEEEDGDVDAMEVETVAVPAAVFGSAKAEAPPKKMGALERLRQKK